MEDSAILTYLKEVTTVQAFCTKYHYSKTKFYENFKNNAFELELASNLCMESGVVIDPIIVGSFFKDPNPVDICTFTLDKVQDFFNKNLKDIRHFYFLYFMVKRCRIFSLKRVELQLKIEGLADAVSFKGLDSIKLDDDKIKKIVEFLHLTPLELLKVFR